MAIWLWVGYPAPVDGPKVPVDLLCFRMSKTEMWFSDVLRIPKKIEVGRSISPNMSQEIFP